MSSSVGASPIIPSILRTPTAFRTPSTPATPRHALGVARPTKRTRLDKAPSAPRAASATPAHASSFSVAITENKMKEIGLAAVDARSPCITFTQYVDSHQYSHTITLLHRYNPVTVLIPNTSICSELKEAIESNFGDGITIEPLNRKYFSETTGEDVLTRLVLKTHSPVKFLSVEKYLALASLAALVKYSEFSNNVTYAPGSVKIEYTPIEGTMMIDWVSVMNLELIHNARSGDAKHSLFGILNHTCTPGGDAAASPRDFYPYTVPISPTTASEYLAAPFRPRHHQNSPAVCRRTPGRRSWLFQRTQKQSARAVCFLLAQPCTRYRSSVIDNAKPSTQLKTVLKPFPDIDALLMHIVQIPKRYDSQTCRAALNNLIQVKQVLELLPSLSAALSECRNPLLVAIRAHLANEVVAEILDSISQTINELTSVQDTKYYKSALKMRNQQAFAIKPGINGLLDTARKVYCETMEDLHDAVNGYRVNFAIPNLKMEFDAKRGYHLSVPSNTRLEGTFVQVIKKRKKLFFSTEELISLNARHNDSLTEILLLTERIITGLLDQVRQHVSHLYQLSEAVSLLDLLAAFASYVTIGHGLIQPDFKEGTLAIKEGRHAIMENVLDTFIPNDTFVDSSCNFQVITGPNMSGKSTYLRQLAIMTVMAHIGCHVPAVFANIPLVDRIFTRIGTGDDIEANCSSFMAEMREAAFILQNCTENSLIIMDELGRSTSSLDGCSIAWAISESLIQTKGWCFLATHYRKLCELEDVYPNAQNHRMSVDVYYADQKPSFLYKVEKQLQGRSVDVAYGIHLAEMAGLPSRLIELAHQFHRKLELRENSTDSGSTDDRRVVSRLCNQVCTLMISSLTDGMMRDQVQRLQSQYPT